MNLRPRREPIRLSRPAAPVGCPDPIECVHEARIGELEERLYRVEQERDEARAEAVRIGQVCDAQVETLGAKLDQARNDVVRLGKELEAERRLTAAYAEQARTHRCNPPGLVDLLIQEGTRG